MRTTLRLLDLEFIGIGEVKGSKFTQKHATTSSYVYEVDSGGGNVHFEVFKRLKASLCINFEKRLYSDTEFKEVYPKSRDFSIWAWTFMNEKDALNKLKILEDENKTKNSKRQH